MLRLLVSLFLLASCSMGTVETGGHRRYAYDAQAQYNPEQLKEMAPEMVTTSYRNPQFGTLDKLFGNGQPPLKRVGIIVFETRIQPTYEGLAKRNMVYLSEAGKQIMTENFLRIWEQSIGLLAPELEYVPTGKIKKTKAFHQYGSLEENFVKSKRSTLQPDDIFFRESGQKTTTTTILNARGMRDVSFLLVPAGEMMAGPKWSEQNKHFLNDIAKELKLDAAIVVLSDVSWTAAHTDKHSGELIPEEIKFHIQASTLIPLSSYHQRLEKLNDSSKPNVTLAYRKYDAKISIPVLLSVPEENKNFETIEKELLSPMMKTYNELSQMTIMRINEDLKLTW